MKFTLLTILIIFISINSNLIAQKGSGNSKIGNGLGIIGIVKDTQSEKTIEYANIVILKTDDSTQVSGGVTNTEGEFNITGIRPGNYIAKISFIGFEATYVDDIILSRTNRLLDIGEIHIQPASYQLEDAKVVANKTPIEYKIDKKVINVSEQVTTISGSAVDVLENVPSVRVDIEGNVSLRGSGSFTLLIDGRPSVLDASDALEQIPASAIDKIEIITNPSAKYNPEGVSGIINIISEENQLEGFSGIINANVGLDEKYGGNFTTTYRTKNHSFNIGANYNTRYFPGTSDESRMTFNDTDTSYLHSIGESNRGRTGWSIRGGGDLNLSQNDVLGFSMRYGDRTSERTSDINFHNYTAPATKDLYYKSNNIRERSGAFFSSNLNYKHTFGANQHKIYAEAMYQKRNSDESTINEYIESDGTISSGRKNTEIGPGERFRLKVDYTYPISEDSKFETGAKHETNLSQDDTKSFIFDATNLDYQFENEYSYIIDYTRNISALYGIYSGMISNVGYQAGLRGEYTYREIDLVDSNQTTLIDRIDYFPTIHATYKLNEIQQIMASYTSRIRRPRGWYLEPFDVWQDANNIRRGNPNLEPEYIDSYELAFLTDWGESLISVEGYYRIRNNKIESIRSVYDKDVTIRTYDNVGNDYSFGTEFMINTDLIKLWNINFMSDLYHYRVEGNYDEIDFSRENFNWSIRLNNTFQIFESTKLQINSRYNSASISAQNEMEGFFSTNIAIRQDLFDKMLSLSLQVR
ncbi:MAG: TonB-dependent receptor, partial [Melioribacteraceae bacterium]|nr:TonB-dependent receptor [Melioribacteraceae bacterium]